MENFTISENSAVDILRVSQFRFFCLVLNRSSVFKSSVRLFSAEVIPWFLRRVWEKECCRTNKTEYTLHRAELFHTLDMLYFRSVSEERNWLEREVVKFFSFLDFLEAVQNGALR